MKDFVARHVDEYAKKVDNGEELELPNLAEWAYNIEFSWPLSMQMRQQFHIHS